MIRRTLLAAALLLSARDGFADDGRPGRVVLSDGTSCEGRLSFTEGVLLHLVDPATGKGRDLLPADVSALLFHVDEESVERPYAFTKPGRDEKAYGAGAYPLRELLCTVVARTGERFEGHLKTTVAYVQGAEGEEARRFVLRRQWKGSVGQTLDDLVYAREVRFTDVVDAKAPPAATLEVSVRGLGRLRAASAYGIGSRLVFAGSVLDPEKGRVRFDALPAGDYDVAVLGADRALVGCARDGEAKRPLSDVEDRAPLEEIVAKGDDLYDRRDLVAVGGSRDAARVVVAKRVTRRTTNDAAFGRGSPLAAVDVWTAHRLEREWRIDARANLLRVVLGKDEAPPRVLAEPRLAAVRAEPGKTARIEIERTEDHR